MTNEPKIKNKSSLREGEKSYSQFVAENSQWDNMSQVLHL